MAIHKDTIQMKKDRDAKKGVDYHASMSGPYLHVYADYDIIPIEKVSGLEIVPVETVDHGTILRVNIRQRRGGARLCIMNPSELIDLVGRIQSAVASDPTDQLEASAAAMKETLYGKQQGYCSGCKVHLEPRMFEIDHVVPQSKGGASTIDNLQLLCSPCNKSKGNKTMAEWQNDRAGAA